MPSSSRRLAGLVLVFLIVCAISTVTADDEVYSFRSSYDNDNNSSPFGFSLNASVRGDSVHFKYQVNLIDYPLDSVILEVLAEDRPLVSISIFPPDSTRVPPGFQQYSKLHENRLYTSGEFDLSKGPVPEYRWTCAVTEYHRDSTGGLRSNREELRAFRPPERKPRLMFEYPMPMGMFNSDIPGLNKSGFLMGIAAGVVGDYSHLRFCASTNWTGLGKNFSFSEPARFDVRFYTGTRDNFMPQFEAAATYSRLLVKKNDITFKKSESGFGGALAFEGPFERFSYGYNTACGGYHTLELFFATNYLSNSKQGTRYQFVIGDDIWLFRISYLVDPFTPAVPTVPERGMNSRPLYHTILATTAAVPLLLLVTIICPGCIGD